MILRVFEIILNSDMVTLNYLHHLIDQQHLLKGGMLSAQHVLTYLSSIFPDLFNSWLYCTFPIGFYYLLNHDKRAKESNSLFILVLAYLFLIGMLRAADLFLPGFELNNVTGFWVASSGLVLALATKFLPEFLKSANATKLRKINHRLEMEILERKKVEKRLKEHQENLELLVQQRTADLENTAIQLQREINEHKEAQVQISIQTSLLEQVDSAIVATDLQYNIIYWNQCAESLFGWKKTDVLGKPVVDVMIRKEHRTAGKRFLDKIANRKTWSGDITVPHRMGGKIPVELSCSSLTDAQGIQIGYTCVAIDISDHVRSERKLQREKDKAIRQAHAKQHFLATMSHEIRTPLNVILGMTRLLHDAKPNRKQSEYLHSLEFSANHLLTIINDILDLAKIDAGKIKLEHIGFNLSHVVDGVKKAFSARAEEKNLDLRIDIPEDLPMMLKGDQVRLTQILNNLVSNALKFTNEGFITIRVRVLDNRQNKVRLRFEVSDSGIGIAEDKLEQIFENFTQAQEDTTRKYGGTGLGLTICKKLVQLQKGKIEVKSKVGIGSTFGVELSYDLEQQMIVKEESPERLHYTLQGVKLLLVEDNHANRIVASNFLAKMGAKVDFAENGQEALQLIQEQTFDIVLMDLQMPVMNGFEATQQIRKLGESYTKLPIIALTADVVSDVRKKVYNSGMNDYLAKPFNPEQLNTTIAKHLNLTASTNTEVDNENVMTLCQIIEEYSDDTNFIETLLESLKSSFDKLSFQIQETARQKDIYALRRIIHKLQPSIRMMENMDLYPKLLSLKESLSQDEINDTEIRLLLDDIHKSSKQSVHYLDRLQKNSRKLKTKV